ncbi:MAG: NAD(P)/FAD-dependent oxidoreductase [Alicyclobacillus sp.]|nr:NAD(P)/FAD-dependent oxidoreductase [Alicyclobacillus sp.]
MGQQIERFDVVVVGGGPAGLMAAIAAQTAGAKTLLVEKGHRLGRKLGISGGGRCNVTNAKPLPELMQNIPGNGRFLHSALHQFSNEDVRRFFEDLGIRLKEEDRGRVFPVSDKAATVVQALVDKVYAVGVEVWEDAPVADLLHEPAESIGDASAPPADGRGGGPARHVTGIRLQRGVKVHAQAVIVATGGASVPKTGSTGDAYPWARRVGHTVIPPYPTEVPLTSDDWFIRDRTLQGLSMQGVDVSVWNGRGKRLTTEHGDLIFTHLGLSGPVALRCSHYVSTARLRNPEEPLRAEINLTPGTSRGDWLTRWERLRREVPRRQVGSLLREMWPDRLAGVLIHVTGLNPATQLANLRTNDLARLVDTTSAFPVRITGTLPLAQATVTGGGVSVREIDPRTMASKRCAGLYFAGEVMDVHAHTGGYNITVAFSTGHCAGTHAAAFARQERQRRARIPSLG